MQHQDIQFEICGDDKEVAVIRLTRGAKRNALSDGLILALRNIFEELPSSVRAAVIDGEGPHFCAGQLRGPLAQPGAQPAAAGGIEVDGLLGDDEPAPVLHIAHASRR